MKRFVGFTCAMIVAAFAVVVAGSVAEAGWRHHHRCHRGHGCAAPACDTGCAVESCEPAPVVQECVVDECAPSHGCHRRHRCGLFGHRRHCHHRSSCESSCETVESSCGSCGGETVVSSGCASGDCGGGEVISSGEVISHESTASNVEVIKEGTPTPAASKAPEASKAKPVEAPKATGT